MFETILIVAFILCLALMIFVIYFQDRKKNAENEKVVYVARALECCSFDEATRKRLIKLMEEKEQSKTKNK